jgi:type IV pilus assembly protein PilP
MARNSRHYIRCLLIGPVTLGLVACSGDPTADLEIYVAEVKDRQVEDIDPLPEFKPYESFTYLAADLRDPFTEPTFAHPQAVVARTSDNGIKPDFDRPTEALEEFPLDSLRMVGTLEQNEENWALINDTDGTIHRVQMGNYAGQNHGKITHVSEFEIELTEIVPDGIGGWMERQASIAISE